MVDWKVQSLAEKELCNSEVFCWGQSACTWSICVLQVCSFSKCHKPLHIVPTCHILFNHVTTITMSSMWGLSINPRRNMLKKLYSRTVSNSDVSNYRLCRNDWLFAVSFFNTSIEYLFIMSTWMGSIFGRTLFSCLVVLELVKGQSELQFENNYTFITPNYANIGSVAESVAAKYTWHRKTSIWKMVNRIRFKKCSWQKKSISHISFRWGIRRDDECLTYRLLHHPCVRLNISCNAAVNLFITAVSKNPDLWYFLLHNVTISNHKGLFSFFHHCCIGLDVYKQQFCSAWIRLWGKDFSRALWIVFIKAGKLSPYFISRMFVTMHLFHMW